MKTQITNNTVPDWCEDINNNDCIVVRSFINGINSPPELFLYCQGNKVQLTHNTIKDFPPHALINNNGDVVWMSYDGNDWVIFIYHNGEIIQLTHNEHDDMWPRINDNGDVVWYGHDGNSWEIFLATPTIKITVEIDVKPGIYPNCFNLNGHGIIPVAILGSSNLDVSNIKTDDSLSFNGLEVRVRGNKGPLCSIEDSSGDEFLDLVCHFEDDPEQWLEGTDDNAILKGELIDGIPIEGTDSICIVP